MLSGCRRIIGLDEAFLKGVCKVQLLVAASKDENNQTWAVIEMEDKATWK